MTRLLTHVEHMAAAVAALLFSDHMAKVDALSIATATAVIEFQRGDERIRISLERVEPDESSDDGGPIDGDPEVIDVPHVDLLVTGPDGPIFGPISCRTLAASIAYSADPDDHEGWTTLADGGAECADWDIRFCGRISREGQASDE